MVISLGPGKFYGSSLPRPRYYTDVKFNTERVDPPVPVMDPFLSWASEAHWSMGGLSFKRLRLQGKIEGNVEKLRKQRDRDLRGRRGKGAGESGGKIRELLEWLDDDGNESKGGIGLDESPPPAPVAEKRRKRVVVESEKEGGVKKRRLARKLTDEFDRVEGEGLGKKKSNGGVGLRGSENVGVRLTRSRRLLVDEEGNGDDSDLKLKTGKKSASALKGESGGGGGGAGARTSPRLAKKRSS